MEIFTFLLMLLMLGISLWNAYSAGYNSVALQYYKGKFKEFFNIANSFGLVLAFSGAAYALAYFLSLLLYSMGKISADVVMLISAYQFLVFGTLIVFTGIVITIESILIAYLRRDFTSVLIAIYNTFASVLNLYTYFTSIKDAYAIINGAMGGDEEDSKSKAIAVLIAAAIFAIILVYLFYRMGKQKAERELHA